MINLLNHILSIDRTIIKGSDYDTSCIYRSN
jgi:hypothetical protein